MTPTKLREKSWNQAESIVLIPIPAQLSPSLKNSPVGTICCGVENIRVGVRMRLEPLLLSFGSPGFRSPVYLLSFGWSRSALDLPSPKFGSRVLPTDFCRFILLQVRSRTGFLAQENHLCFTRPFENHQWGETEAMCLLVTQAGFAACSTQRKPPAHPCFLKSAGCA